MTQPKTTSGKGDLLRVEDLRLAFDIHGSALEVVKGVSFRIKPGSVVALVGESGSGKSVISQAIMGILPNSASITGGSITFRDPEQANAAVDIAQLRPDSEDMRSLRGGRISMIFQEPMTSLSPLHTVGDQVEEALMLHQEVEPGQARERTEEMLQMVGFPDPARAYNMYSFELSGGLRQRAMIAMALICRPALLIADEPTTALDVTVQAQILKLLKDLQEKLGMAVLLITHDLGVVANMADEVVVIYHGQLMEAGNVKDIFNAPGHDYLRALLKAVPHFDMREGERLVPLREVEFEIGPLLGKDEAKGRSQGTEALLSVKDLTKSFSIRKGSFFGPRTETEVKAVDAVSFDIARGECLGLVGESGCGKTTVSKMLMRAVTPNSGAISFNDGNRNVDLLGLEGDELKKFRKTIQMVFQDPFSSLSPRMTVLNILREPLIIHEVGDEATQSDMVAELMRLVGLDPRFLNRYPHSFSGGQRQRIGIARALALSPELLICDEPVSALDVSVQAQILNLLKDLQKELGLTYLFISHNLAVVDYVADRIAVMCRGQLVEVAPREALFKRPVHSYTRALLKAVPYADLERPLDLNSVELKGASDMNGWDPCFQHQDGDACGLQHIELEDGHIVLAKSNADLKELRP
ncbi:MAG: ABC transporter ATP-binding protein [Hyphomicrobiales bacterium]